MISGLAILGHTGGVGVGSSGVEGAPHHFSLKTPDSTASSFDHVLHTGGTTLAPYLKRAYPLHAQVWAVG